MKTYQPTPLFDPSEGVDCFLFCKEGTTTWLDLEVDIGGRRPGG